MVQPNPGAQPLTALTGSEIVDILGLEWQTATTSQISGLGGSLQVLTAAGSTQGTATAITLPNSGTKAIKAIVAVATTVSTHGVKLPAAATGRTVQVSSAGSFGVKVYPSTGQKIGAASTNSADTTIAVNKANTYIGVSTTKWVVERGS